MSNMHVVDRDPFKRLDHDATARLRRLLAGLEWLDFHKSGSFGYLTRDWIDQGVPYH